MLEQGKIYNCKLTKVNHRPAVLIISLEIFRTGSILLFAHR